MGRRRRIDPLPPYTDLDPAAEMHEQVVERTSETIAKGGIRRWRGLRVCLHANERTTPETDRPPGRLPFASHLDLEGQGTAVYRRTTKQAPTNFVFRTSHMVCQPFFGQFFPELGTAVVPATVMGAHPLAEYKLFSFRSQRGHPPP